MLDPNNVENRKQELEEKFLELKLNASKLQSQIQIATKAFQLLSKEMIEVGASYKEVCKILGVDPEIGSAEIEKRYKATLADNTKDETKK